MWWGKKCVPVTTLHAPCVALCVDMIRALTINHRHASHNIAMISFLLLIELIFAHFCGGVQMRSRNQRISNDAIKSSNSWCSWNVIDFKKKLKKSSIVAAEAKQTNTKQFFIAYEWSKYERHTSRSEEVHKRDATGWTSFLNRLQLALYLFPSRLKINKLTFTIMDA